MESYGLILQLYSFLRHLALASDRVVDEDELRCSQLPAPAVLGCTSNLFRLWSRNQAVGCALEAPGGFRWLVSSSNSIAVAEPSTGGGRDRAPLERATLVDGWGSCACLNLLRLRTLWRRAPSAVGEGRAG